MKAKKSNFLLSLLKSLVYLLFPAIVALSIAPALAQKTVAPIATPQTQLQKGEYLARAGDCISCHQAPGGKPFAGGLRIDTPFGYMLSPNITPDVKTGIGSWSANDFYRALHDGINKKHQELYPTMPYDFYTKATREDIDAIYAYLRTVPAVSNQVEVNHLDFPFNIRLSMIGWRELFFKEGTYQPNPSKPASWNRGAYLVEGFGHCSDCHSPRDIAGGIEKKKAYTGAVIDGWFALNLSSNITTGLGSWTAEDIAKYLKTGSYKGKTAVLGPMGEVVHNSMQYMTDADLNAMAEYLKSLPPNSSLYTGRAGPDPSKIIGAKLYIDNCSGCHLSKGAGVSGVIPPLAGNPVVNAPDPANIIKVVLSGIHPRANYIAMPAFKARLNDQEIAEIANYGRTSWGNTAPANATPDMVAKIRKNLGN